MRRISVSMPRFRYERLPHFTQIAHDPGKPMFSEALSLPYSEKAASFSPPAKANELCINHGVVPISDKQGLSETLPSQRG
jgi:hypothetical protein